MKSIAAWLSVLPLATVQGQWSQLYPMQGEGSPADGSEVSSAGVANALLRVV